jgi:hypothetical protein
MLAVNCSLPAWTYKQDIEFVRRDAWNSIPGDPTGMSGTARPSAVGRSFNNLRMYEAGA